MKKLIPMLLTIIMLFSTAMPTTVSAASKPAKVKLSSVAASSSTSIKIKWKKVSGADGYVIYQKAGSGSYKKVKTITSGKTTSYTKKSLSSGKKYTYKIRAYDKSGSKKIYGAYSATKSTYTKPAKVKLSSVTATSSTSIKIKWKKVSGADGYVIYQKTGSGSYKKIKTITSGKTTSYTKKKLSANKKYTYKIKAYKKIGSKRIYSGYSVSKSVKTKANIINPKKGLKEHADYYLLSSMKDGHFILDIWQFYDYQLHVNGVYSTNKEWADHDGIITYKGMTFYPMGYGGDLPQYTLTDKEIILKYSKEINAPYANAEDRLIINSDYNLEVVYSTDMSVFKKGAILELVE